jgi:hypothetical protein
VLRIDLGPALQQADARQGVGGQVELAGLLPGARGGAAAALVVDQGGDPLLGKVSGLDPVIVALVIGGAVDEDDGGDGPVGPGQ